MASVRIGDYKIELLKTLLESDEIVNNIESLQDDVYSPEDLIYKNLFPYGYVPNTQLDADSYILVLVDVHAENYFNRSFSDMRVIIRVLVHKDRQKMSTKAVTRMDFLADEICDILDGHLGFGQSVLRLKYSREEVMNEDYTYRDLVFVAEDLKPSTRKKVGKF